MKVLKKIGAVKTYQKNKSPKVHVCIWIICVGYVKNMIINLRVLGKIVIYLNDFIFFFYLYNIL